tara:strand:- start:733 stop:1146 length:414 start_codon:yes stop_codon:yes gene_type:complete
MLRFGKIFFIFLSFSGATASFAETEKTVPSLPGSPEQEETTTNMKQPEGDPPHKAQPAKTIIESYVSRRKTKQRKIAPEPLAFKPQPRHPANCSEEVRHNYRECMKDKKRQSRQERRKCRQYRKWFKTRCENQAKSP